jgi:hypothetical protein
MSYNNNSFYFGASNSTPNPLSLNHPSTQTEKSEAMGAALLALVDEYNAYQSTNQQQPPVLAMYATKIQSMATNLHTFLNSLGKEAAQLQTYIDTLNGKISSLAAENKALMTAGHEINSHSSLSVTMQTEVKNSMQVQTYINYSLYVGLLMEICAIGYMLANPNTADT